MKLSERIDSILNGVDNMENMREEITAFTEQETKVMKDDINREFGAQQEWYYQSVVRERIDQFYNDYTPRSYDERRMDLYDVYQPEIDDSGMVVVRSATYDDLFLDSVPTGREGCNLYDLVFRHGYHGGAAGTDKRGETKTAPHYRKPVPYYSAWDGAAVRMSPSPYELIRDELMQEEGGYVFDLFRQISRSHNEAFCAKVNQKIAGMMAARARNL